MECKRKLLYSDVEGKVEELLAYIFKLEEERDNAQRELREWNAEDTLLRLRYELLEAQESIGRGFAPTEHIWNVIKAWEDKHALERHPRPKIKEERKFIPNQPEYRYQFEETILGDKVGSVICLTCARRAMRRSFGNGWLYKKLCERYGAEYLIDEFEE